MMADDFDWASGMEQREREASIARARKQALEAEQMAAFYACVECGGDIPPQRKHANPAASRCVDCQAALERRTRR